jgi:hypothetical protein
MLSPQTTHKTEKNCSSIFFSFPKIQNKYRIFKLIQCEFDKNKKNPKDQGLLEACG